MPEFQDQHDTSLDKTEKKRLIKYQSAFEQSRDAVMFLDRNGYLDCNQSALHMFRVPDAETFCSCHPADLSPEYFSDGRSSRKEAQARIAEAFDQGRAFFQWLHRTWDGEEFPAEVLLSRIDMEDGPILQAVVRDITLRKNLEDSLLRELNYSNAIISSLPGIFYLIDQQGRLVSWNRNLEQVSGRSSQEIRSMTAQDFVVQEERELIQNAVMTVFETGSVQVESHLLSRTGSTIPYLLSGTRIELSGESYLIGAGIDISERKDMERAMYASEQRYRRLFEASPVSIWEQDFSEVKKSLDELGERGVSDIKAHIRDNPALVRELASKVRVLDVNQATLKLYRASSKKDLLTGIEQVFCEESYQNFIADLLAIIDGSTEFCLEQEHRALNGESLEVQLYWTVPPDFTQSYSRVLVNVIDVTRTRQVERRQRQLLEILENSPDYVGLRTPRGRILYLNATARRWLGVSSLDLQACLNGQTDVRPELQELDRILQTSFPDWAARRIREEGLPKAMESGYWEGESAFLDCRGEEIPVSQVIMYGKDEHGRPNWLATIMRDVSRIRLAEEEVQKKAQLLRKISDNMFDLVSLTDLAGNYKFVSASFQILGYHPDSLMGRNIFELVHPGDLDRVSAEFQEAMDRLEERTVECRYKCADGSYLWFEIRGGFIFGVQGGVPRELIFSGRDITRRKEMEAELMRSNKDLEQFAYSVSHDMRQPLRSIAMHLQMLERALGGDLDLDQRSSLNFAVDGARRMEAMVNSLLEYSRVGRKTEPKDYLDSRQVLDEALDYLEPEIRDKQARIEIFGDWPRVFASRDEIVRLFQNLLHNAVKYHDQSQPPRVDITSAVNGDLWRVEVKDNGIGIDPGQQERLFAFFSRLQPRRRFEGTGMGLALCRRIVENHAGSIGVESTGEGRGSTFWFEIPWKPSG